MDKVTDQAPVQKVAVSACDVEALKRCLEKTNGDHTKCQAEVAAFRSCGKDK
jgi:hypothetical protein